MSSLFTRASAWLTPHLRTVEMVGVLMRIASFTVVSWMGPASPFLWVWLVNTVDAILLTWCALIKRDPPYILLNAFWIGVGILGIVKAMPPAH